MIQSVTDLGFQTFFFGIRDFGTFRGPDRGISVIMGQPRFYPESQMSMYEITPPLDRPTMWDQPMIWTAQIYPIDNGFVIC